MAGDGGRQQLPSGPSTLCFNKDEFMKENFSIDRFVSECRKNVPLETLREDLGIYLRLLRAAMIELINQDYADFVNLSGNLVGLDKAIAKLSVPLEQFRDEIKAVKASVDNSICQIERKLGQHKSVREKKISLQLLMCSIQCVDRIEAMLRIKTTDGIRSSCPASNLDGNTMERIASEFNRLQFVVTRSKGLALIEKLKPRIFQITTVLQKNLEESFLHSLTCGDLGGLSQCLRIYAAVGKVRDAEDLFRKRIVAPYMESVVNEKLLRFNPQGLGDLYLRILEFIPKHCTVLKGISETAFRESSGEFDFLVNSVWPEVVSSVEIRLPILCDVTDPNVFHERYTITVDFLEKFEEECGSVKAIARLREHEAYGRFLGRWNTAVYFQIRFQEIASALESVLCNHEIEMDKDDGDGAYLLIQTNTLLTCLRNCWLPNVFLAPLAHKFWKLTLLLLSRYEKWATDVIDTTSSERCKAADVTAAVNSTTLDGSDDRPVNGLTGKLGEDSLSSSQPSSFTYSVALASDLQGLLQHVPNFLNEEVYPLIPLVAPNCADTLNGCVGEVSASLADLLPRLGQTLIDTLSVQCCLSLKSVYDIPRLFRRTNREVPNKPSTYVANTLKPLEAFLKNFDHLIPSSCRQQWIHATVVNICLQYLSVTSEVLTSVKKMEDSLKRLKEARHKLSLATPGNVSGVTDDDKIRLQLALDVEHFGQQVKSLGSDFSAIPSFQQLVELVESARSSPSSTS